MTCRLVPLLALPLEPIVTLNNEHAIELSYADAPRLKQLIDCAYFAKATEDAAAFLIAFDQDADYDSENFLWFKTRYNRFIYVDRVVVAAAARGRGLARHLYDSLFSAARGDGYPRIVCEVNCDPPNHASDAFHNSFGFAPVGTENLSARNKSVRYLLKSL